MPADDDIDSLLSRYEPPVEALARELLALVRELRPEFSARVAFGWATVNFHHPGPGSSAAIYLRRRPGVAGVSGRASARQPAAGR